MRITILLVLLLSALGYAHRVSQRRYPMVDVEVPGTGKHYQVWMREDRCEQNLCALSAVMLVNGTDVAGWRTQVEGLLPYLATQAKRGKHQGAQVLAARPGFARLFAPKAARWYVYYWSGRHWELREESDASEQMGLDVE